jgi:hypothetical protein
MRSSRTFARSSNWIYTAKALRPGLRATRPASSSYEPSRPRNRPWAQRKRRSRTRLTLSNHWMPWIRKSWPPDLPYDVDEDSSASSDDPRVLALQARFQPADRRYETDVTSFGGPRLRPRANQRRRARGFVPGLVPTRGTHPRFARRYRGTDAQRNRSLKRYPLNGSAGTWHHDRHSGIAIVA